VDGIRNIALMKLIQINRVQLEVKPIEPTHLRPDLAPLVFLHEGLGSVAMWRDWPQVLCDATGRAGWVYSRQGYGTSDPVPDVRTTGRLTADYMHQEAWTVLPTLLKTLAIENPVLVGHSDGGTIALLHACHHAVTACVVMAPHVMVEEVSVNAITQAREAFEKGDLRERLARYHSDVDGAFWQWNDVWLSPAFRSFDIRDACTQIKAPVLAIQGINDPYGSLQQIEQINVPARQIRRVTLPQCGHSPHREQADLTTRTINEFLTTVG
jgi:pimeloyl-ACP methyl ester carboxylesterase